MADGYLETGHYGDDKEKINDIDRRVSVIGERGEIVNASGHRDQLQRHYGLVSICGLALTIDNAWVALGGSIAVSISTVSLERDLYASVDALADNGGPAGVIYELLVACFYYGFIAASIAEVRP